MQYSTVDQSRLDWNRSE